MLKSCFTCDHFDSCTLICKFADFITNNANSIISNECKNWVQKTNKSRETIYVEYIKQAEQEERLNQIKREKRITITNK